MYYLSGLLLLSLNAIAQCPVGNVDLTTQAEVDLFVSTYPTCTTIDGDLSIFEPDGFGIDIVSISGLTSITTINGDLFIAGTGITALTGLDNLKTIGGVLTVANNLSLTTCDLLSICTYLNLNQATVLFNGEGCSTDEEITDKCNVVLPVSLINFTARTEAETVLLGWRTAAETNSRNFEIQHGLNGKSWTLLGSVDALGESTSTHAYAFVDKNPASGNNFYRLKMIDRDNSFTYSQIQQVKLNMPEESAVFPNPVSDKLQFKMANPGQVGRVRMYDMTGKIVFESAAKASVTGFDVKHLASGTYMLQITDNKGEAKAYKVLKN